MTSPAYIFDPFDRVQRARTMKMCAALEALESLERSSLPAAPCEPDQPAPSPGRQGGVEPVPASPDHNSAAAASSRGRPQPGAGAAEPGHNSDTAGMSLPAVTAGLPTPSAVEAGEPSPSLTGSPAAVSVPVEEPAEPYWPVLTARVIDRGETPAAIAAEIGASVELVASMVVEELTRRRHGAQGPDWPALVARVIEGGETPSKVAKAAAVHPSALAIRVNRARAGWVFGPDGKQTIARGRPLADPTPPPSLEAFRDVGSRCMSIIGEAATREIVGGRKGWAIPAGERAGLIAKMEAAMAAAPKEIPSEPEASTPQGADAPGDRQDGPEPAGAEAVGEDGADPSLSPADAAPEEAEGSSGLDAAAGESPAPEQPAEPPIPGARTDPDPGPLPEPEPVDAVQPAALIAERPRIDVRRRDTDPEWEAILARVDAGERPDMVAVDEGVDLKALQDQLRARIKAAPATPKPRDSFWTAQRDYELARGIIGGNLQKAAAALAVSIDDAKARWNELLPVKGLNEQAALLMRLRAKAGVAA